MLKILTTIFVHDFLLSNDPEFVYVFTVSKLCQTNAEVILKIQFKARLNLFRINKMLTFFNGDKLSFWLTDLLRLLSKQNNISFSKLV